MGLFDSLFEVVTDTVKIVAAPVEIAVDIIKVPVKEVADVAQELVKDVKDAVN